MVRVEWAVDQNDQGPAVKVLVVEDEVLIRLMLADALRAEGFQVFEAARLEEALAILRTMHMDVVVSDMHLGARDDGMLLARHVLERCPGTPLVLAAATPPMDAFCFDAVFMKPYSPEKIAAWIRDRTAATADLMAAVAA